MIVGIGIDHVAVDRMEGLLERRPRRARRRLFTAAERETCDGRARPAECFAARFAAKEALLKALGTGWARGMSWTDVEMLSGPDGKPELRLSGAVARRAREAGAAATHVSCTHEAGTAGAVVVLEG